MTEYNGYDLARRWWDFAFRHPSQRTPTHAALYSWYMEWANRCRWPDEFEMAPQYAMTAIGVSSYNTYKKVFADLCQWGFVKLVREGRNQYAPCLIALSKFDEALSEPSVFAVSKNDTPRDEAKPDDQNAMSRGESDFDKPRDIANGVALSNFDKPRDAITINSKENTNGKTKTVLPSQQAENVSLVEEQKKSGQPPPPTPAPAVPSAGPQPLPISKDKVFGDGRLQAEVVKFYYEFPDEYPRHIYRPFLRYWTAIMRIGKPEHIGKERWRTMEHVQWDTVDKLSRWYKIELDDLEKKRNGVAKNPANTSRTSGPRIPVAAGSSDDKPARSGFNRRVTD